MRGRWLYEVITGRRGGFIPSVILAALTPLSILYGSVCVVRRWLYESGLLKQRRLPVPVVCVGSIVAGGAGKTTLMLAIAERLVSRGLRVTILCSGYGGRAKGPTVVSDGERVVADVETVGDEARMVAERMLRWHVPVIAGRDRFSAGRMAIRRFHPDLILLDDGFQHLQLLRDLDVVVMDSANPFGTGRLLPAGTLREPRSALKRADVILTAAHLPSRLRRIGDDEDIELGELRGKKVLALCSIGNPESFRKVLADLGCEVHLLDFPDHHLYNVEDLRGIEGMVLGFDLVVTTAKDEPKLVRLGFNRGLVLEVGLKTDLQALESIILRSISPLSPGRASAAPRPRRGRRRSR